MGEGESGKADGFFSECGDEGGTQAVEWSTADGSREEDNKRGESQLRARNSSTTGSSTPGPAFTIIHKRGKRGKGDENTAITELIQSSILQKRQFRAAARERFEQQREEKRQTILREDRFRAERREDDERRRQYQEKQAKLQRNEDRKARECYMQMLLMVFARGDPCQSLPVQPTIIAPKQAAESQSMDSPQNTCHIESENQT